MIDQNGTTVFSGINDGFPGYDTGSSSELVITSGSIITKVGGAWSFDANTLATVGDTAHIESVGNSPVLFSNGNLAFGVEVFSREAFYGGTFNVTYSVYFCLNGETGALVWSHVTNTLPAGVGDFTIDITQPTPLVKSPPPPP